ncbi:hypothetical protein [Chryseosolibacter indicus]|uniref:Uncharacterized protein n=1 Tax=Chryseosolibacter indicus TaxID=2782351 RepID=A0ABS5VQJ9_9BACT|nr:hypothetical protein [Chryseosolibacter indicus]MBT1703720.1 hypothetical protein [Chryseosolibacter indicus]
MKKTLLAIIILFNCLTTLIAQPSFTVSDKEDARKIKETVLAVVIKQTDEKTIKRLSKKPEDLKSYETSITSLNKFIKDAVSKEWHFSNEVRYITEEEAQKIKDEKNGDYSLLEVTEIKNYKVGDFYSPNANYGFNSARDLAYHMSSSGKSTALVITNGKNPNKEIVYSYLPAVGVSPGTVTFMILHLENQLNDCLTRDINSLSDLKKDIEKRKDALKTKTVIIFDPLISKGLQKTIDKKELEKHYKYKYSVVPFEKADELIASKNKDYAYIWAVPAGASNGGRELFNYYFIDGEDARILFMTGTAVVGANGDFHQAHFAMANKSLK